MAYNIAPSKQDLLVSGTNIKTINSNSILGSGNLTVAGLPTSTNPTDADKVVAVNSSGVASWQYAGLGDGSFGTNNIFLGRSKPSGLAGYSTDNVIIGTDSQLNGASFSGAGNILIGAAGSGQTYQNYKIAIGTSPNSTGNAYNSVSIGSRQYLATSNDSITIGDLTRAANTSVVIGSGAGTQADQSIVIGRSAVLGTGINSIVVGYNSGNLFTLTGASNTVVGSNSFNNASLTSAANNVIVGQGSATSMTTASGCIFLGYLSGKYSTTQSNELFIDNQDRTNYATQQSNSLIYGTFNATPSSQTLKINAALTSTYGLTVTNNDATVSNGNLILNTAGNGLKIKTGADATAGLATISNGNSSVTVNTNKCSATSIILVTNQTSTAYVAVTTKTSGSFKIEHANAVGADQECAWFIINPA